MAIDTAQVLAAAARWGLTQTTPEDAERLAAYGNLLLHWNARVSLTAIRDEAELIERHLMEGLFAAANHPPARNILDFGSGTGIPGVPIAACRKDLLVTLAESQRKKACFLQEVVRQLHLDASVHADRAETLPVASFDAVWMRAVDKRAVMLPVAVSLLNPNGALCLFGTSQPLPLQTDRDDLADWTWRTLPLPGKTSRVLHIGIRNWRSTWNA